MKIKLIWIVYIILFNSCATIRNGNIYYIPIMSEPTNARVKVLDKQGNEIILTTTPDTIALKSGNGFFKRAEYSIEVTSYGYLMKKEPIYFKINKNYFLNIPFINLFGLFIIDPLTGAM